MLAPQLNDDELKNFQYNKVLLNLFNREAMLAEMGVAIGVDGHTVGLFQPRRVSYEHIMFSFFFF